jgi:pSer/pThr/pTyr-binding forkhead associated (FHA) protein
MMRPSEEAAPARSGAGTIIEKPLSRIIRGVLVEYRAPADEGRLHALREGRNKIGRDPDADVVLEEARASGDHAFLFIRGEKVTFQDCSRNGSKVGDRLVGGDQCELGSGSALMIGDTRLVFLLVPEGGAGTP